MRSPVSFDEAIDNPIPYWLMAVYTYEECDHTIMHDADFDLLCDYIVAKWDTLTHPHKHIIDINVLCHKGTALAVTVYRDEWPGMVFGGAHDLLDRIHGHGKWGQPGCSYRAYLERIRRRDHPTDTVDWSDLA